MPLNPEQKRKFVGLIVQHQASLRAYIVSLMPGDPAAADVLQETNIILWEKMDSFEMDSNYIAWAFTIARYEVLSHCRKRKRRNVLSSSPAFVEAITEQISTDLEQGNADLEHRVRVLKQCLVHLSPEERELLKARYSKKTSLAEFSRKTGRTESALRSVVMRARIALRKCISSKLAQSS